MNSTVDLRQCLECGLLAKSVSGKRIYPHRADLYVRRFWLCDCGAYVGSHQGNGEPLGHPVGAEGRKARNAAHAAFDPLWKSGRMRRSDAYKWLADQLGQPAGQTHISWMTAEQARRVVTICSAATPAKATHP
jgi:hypothetical protein